MATRIGLAQQNGGSEVDAHTICKSAAFSAREKNHGWQLALGSVAGQKQSGSADPFEYAGSYFHFRNVRGEFYYNPMARVAVCAFALSSPVKGRALMTPERITFARVVSGSRTVDILTTLLLCTFSFFHVFIGLRRVCGPTSPD
jgi:hypothetical protein